MKEYLKIAIVALVVIVIYNKVLKNAFKDKDGKSILE